MLDAAHATGYFKEKKKVAFENRDATHLSLAIVCPEVISPYYSQMVEAINQRALAIGANTVIHNVGFVQEDVQYTVQRCVEDPHIDAVICLSSLHPSLSSGTVPIVAFGSQITEEYSQIRTSLNGAFTTIRQRYATDVDIAFVGEELTDGRRKAAVSALSIPLTVCGRDRYETCGQDAARQLLQRAALPRVLLCAYDEIAYGVIHELTRHGVHIPHDVEVIAINDIRSSAWVFGGLSTIAYDYGNVFSRVVDDIAADLTAKQVNTRTYTVPTRFIPLATTK